jgi:uncharacterized protein (TIGR02118 family)
MVKVTVLLPKPENQQAFDDHYFGIHVPLVENLPQVQDVSILRTFEVQNMSIHPYIVAQFSFENREVMDQSLASAEGEALYADVSNLLDFLPHPPMILFAE